MIDAYYSGKVDRISPEAPVPVVHVTESEKRLGGAANVARNIKALGATPILCSLIGDDLAAVELKELLHRENMSDVGIMSSAGHMTTVKTRVISGSHHLLRVDEEEIKALNSKEKSEFISLIKSIISKDQIDAVLFEDYDKGLIDSELIEEIVSHCSEKGIITCVDPKKQNFLSYKKVDLFKPNKKELEEGLKIDVNASNPDSIQRADEELRKNLEHQLSLLTLSEHGVFISTPSENELIPAHLRKISDVSGAGDTVISVATLCLTAGVSAHDLAQISNLAGGLVCEKVGVVPIDKQQLLDETVRIYSS